MRSRVLRTAARRERGRGQEAPYQAGRGACRRCACAGRSPITMAPPARIKSGAQMSSSAASETVHGLASRVALGPPQAQLSPIHSATAVGPGTTIRATAARPGGEHQRPHGAKSDPGAVQ